MQQIKRVLITRKSPMKLKSIARIIGLNRNFVSKILYTYKDTEFRICKPIEVGSGKSHLIVWQVIS